MLSPELLKAQLYEYLLSSGSTETAGKRYGKFFAAGNDDLLNFDITNHYPESPADFTENRGRCVISGPVGGTISDLGTIARWPMTIACFALASPDAGFLGEQIAMMLQSWVRSDFPSIRGQCLQNWHSIYYSGPLRNSENALFYSIVSVTATVNFSRTIVPNLGNG